MDDLVKIRVVSERLPGKMKAPESSFVHVGMGVPQESDFLVKLTLEGFRKNLKPLPTSLELPAALRRASSREGIKLRQFNLGSFAGSP